MKKKLPVLYIEISISFTINDILKPHFNIVKDIGKNSALKFKNNWKLHIRKLINACLRYKDIFITKTYKCLA